MLQNLTKKILLVLFTGLMSFSAMSQGMKERVANTHFNELSFYKSGEMYGELAMKEDATAHQIRRAAESYRFIGDAKTSEKYYRILSNNSGVKPKDLYHYAQILKMNEKYTEADKMMAKYGSLEANSISKEHANSSTYLTDLKSIPDKYVISIMDVNTSKSDFAPNYYTVNGERNLTFASARNNNSLYNKKFQWDGSNFLDAWKIQLGGDGEKAEVEKFDKGIKSKYHEGPVSFSNNGTRMYLSRSNYFNKKTSVDSANHNNIKLFIAEKDSNGKWGDLKSFAYNNDSYSLGHASVTADGNTMYFSSDMPGGKGETDIWMSKNENGKWSKPVNVADINTIGREMFPFIGENGTLYFSSDAYAGLGGLDVYRAEANGNGFYSPENMMYPLNTNHDDFALIIDKDGENGYFSSDRDGVNSQGNDDIYRFKMVTPFKPSFITVNGCSRNTVGEIVEETTITLTNTDTKEVIETQVTESGCYTFYDVPQGNYTIRGVKSGWETTKDYTFNTDDAKNAEINNADVELKGSNCNLIGVILDAGNNTPIEGVTVTIRDKKTNEVKTYSTDASGKFQDDLANIACPGGVLDYEIEFTKDGYFPKKVDFNHAITQAGTINLNDFLGGTITLNDAGSFCQINSILYDLDKSNIRPDAAIELDKLVRCMKENPDMVVEIGSHTDCRASEAYNRALASRRAKSARRYVISKGISGKRIFGKGYGESKLINNCACEPTNDSDCTEDEHQLNRRTEFRIVKGGSKIYNTSTNSFGN